MKYPSFSQSTNGMNISLAIADGNFTIKKTVWYLAVMKLNEMKCRCFRPLVCTMRDWIGPGTAWANEVKFLWNLPQSSIEPTTFYSQFSALPLDHDAP